MTVRQALGLILRRSVSTSPWTAVSCASSSGEPETRLFDINYIATQRTGEASVGTPASARDTPFARVSSTTSTDVFDDLAKGVQTLLSEHATFNVDRKAGLLQVTDFPERLDRVAVYLDAVQDRVHRQVQIDARVIEVELNDEKAPGVDWTGGDGRPGGVGGRRTGLRVTDLAALMTALQGKVSTDRQPAAARAQQRAGDRAHRRPDASASRRRSRPTPS